MFKCLIIATAISIRFTSVLIIIPLYLLNLPTLKKITKEIILVFLFIILLHTLENLIKQTPIFSLPSFVNNIIFNVLENRSGLYGVHSFHWYFTSALPQILAFYIPCVNLKSKFNIIILFYVLILSLTPHKELRFITPILPLIFSQIKIPPKALLFFILTLNLLVAIFLNTIWQHGAVASISIIRPEVEQRIHLLTECHQTPSYGILPVYSVLDGMPLDLDVIDLDCGPECRENGDCESERFMNHKLEFIESRYSGYYIENLAEYVVYQFENEKEEKEGREYFKTGKELGCFWRNRFKVFSGGEGFLVYKFI